MFKMHRIRHESWEQSDMTFFEGQDESDIDVVLRFMNTYNGYVKSKLAELLHTLKINRLAI